MYIQQVLPPLLVAFVSLALGAVYWLKLETKYPLITIETALQKAPLLYLLIPFSLVVLGIQVAVVVKPDLTWSWPVFFEYYHVELLLSAVLSSIGLLFGLGTCGAVRTKNKQWPALPFAFLILTSLLLGIEYDFTKPVASDLQDQQKDGIVLQSSPFSCAAASGANLARVYGQNSTESEVAKALGTTRFGTSPAQVVYGLKKLGFTCSKHVYSRTQLDQVTAPAVLFLPPQRGKSEGHAILLKGRSGDRFQIIDPLSGLLEWTTEIAATTWFGHTVECTPTGR